MTNLVFPFKFLPPVLTLKFEHLRIKLGLILDLAGNR